MRNYRNVNTLQHNYFLFCLLFPPSFTNTQTDTLAWGLERAQSVYVVTFSCKMWSNVTYGLKKERCETERWRDSDREREGEEKKGQKSATETSPPPPSRFMVCAYVCVSVCVW